MRHGTSLMQVVATITIPAIHCSYGIETCGKYP